MGAGVILEAGGITCDGKDVAKSLRKVFGKPGSNEYIAAQAQIDLFAEVANGAGDYAKLYDAYMKAGVDACDTWKAYLKTLGQAEIIRIAHARFDGLRANGGEGAPMKINTHNPQKNGDHHVHVSSDLEDGTITIDSPFTAASVVPARGKSARGKPARGKPARGKST